MKLTIDAGMALDMFRNYDRDYYTWEAIETLLEWYDELDPNTEFDVIGICCDWNEYGETPCLTWNDLERDFSYLLSRDDWEAENEGGTEEEYREALLDELENRTTVIRLSGSALVMAF